MDAFTSFPTTTTPTDNDNASGDYTPTTPTTVAYIETGRLENLRGQAYTVRLNTPDGEVIARDKHAPVHAACRELALRGIAGKLLVYRAGKPSPDIIVRDIAKAARLTVTEGAASPLRVVAYNEPFAGRVRR